METEHYSKKSKVLKLLSGFELGPEQKIEFLRNENEPSPNNKEKKAERE